MGNPVVYLQKYLVGDRRRQRQFWLGLSLVYASIYGIIPIQQVLNGEYRVADDARQHLFWMRRFLDPELFPNDLIADYFQSVAPAGYTGLYQLAANLGLDPILFGKLLPPILSLIGTIYCFYLALELFPHPVTGFLATALFNQNLWMRDDLASGTARAFLNPIFLAFLYYLVRRSLIPCAIAIALEGLFYPLYVLISAGLLLLWPLRWRRKLRLSIQRQDYRLCAIALSVALVVMLVYGVSVSEFAPVISLEEARTFPEFLPGGRVAFFHEDFGRFWLSGGRSGIQPALDPPLLCTGLLLPFLWRLPGSDRLRAEIKLLPYLTIVSLALFFIAHRLAFKLHMPSRYTQHSLRVVMALAAAIASTLILESLWRWGRGRSFLADGATIVVFIYLLGYPLSLSNYPKTNYVVGEARSLYDYFARQPKSSLIASLAAEANNLPTFARRSILVGREYAIPYHLGYYYPFRQRFLDLVLAQYSSDRAEIVSFIERYHIDFWLLDRHPWTPQYILDHHWLSEYPQISQQLIQKLQQGQTPALQELGDRCTRFQTDAHLAIAADCILMQWRENNFDS